MASLPLAQMENSCITTTAAKRNVSLLRLYFTHITSTAPIIRERGIILFDDYIIDYIVRHKCDLK